MEAVHHGQLTIVKGLNLADFKFEQNQQSIKMACVATPLGAVQELKQYFSSYLTDTSAAIGAIKRLVYELIAIDLPQSPAVPVAPEMLSIMIGCKKCYDDLRRIQSLLKGHVRAKKNSKSQTSRQSRLSLGNYQQIQKYGSRSIAPLQIEKEEDCFTQWNTIASNKVQSRLTMMTQLSDSERKPPQHKLRAEGDYRIAEEMDMTKKESTSFSIKSEQRSGQGRIRSVQILKKIENLRESRANQLQAFEQGNQECVGIIALLKEQLKSKHAKNSRRLRKK